MAIREERQRQQPGREEETEAPAQVADLRDEQLDDDVSCCLAEIDEVLAEEESEHETAKREFDALSKRWGNRWDLYESSMTEDRLQAFNKNADELKDEFRLWQAQYAHLGLTVRWCCGEPVMEG